MLIDFHTHIFPDKIAHATIEKLKADVKEIGLYETTNFSDGTLTGLKKSMEDNNVDISVVLPVATSVKQIESINNFAENIRDDKVISFGGIHPSCENAGEILEDLKKRGFKGIKLHPEYQKCNIDSERCIKILKKAEELGLYTVIHCGIDVGIAPPLHCAPKQLKNALNYVSGKYIIGAHLAGFDMFDEVEELLVGTPIYMDISAICDLIDPKQFKRIIKNHGPEKILFATDSPWNSPKHTLQILESLNLSEEETDNIKFKNACRILNI